MFELCEGEGGVLAPRWKRITSGLGFAWAVCTRWQACAGERSGALVGQAQMSEDLGYHLGQMAFRAAYQQALRNRSS